MAKAKPRTSPGKKSITPHDVVVHMQGMEQRLTKRVDDNTRAIAHNTRAIAHNADAIAYNTRGISENSSDLRTLTQRVNTMEDKVMCRLDALDEDLTATMTDTLKIRRHVGMAVPDDE